VNDVAAQAEEAGNTRNHVLLVAHDKAAWPLLSHLNSINPNLGKNPMNDTRPEQSANYAKLLVDEANPELAHLREKVEMLMNERVTPALGAVADHAQTVVRNASNEFRQQTTRLSETVQQQPFMAIAMAAAAGFVLAKLARR